MILDPEMFGPSQPIGTPEPNVIERAGDLDRLELGEQGAELFVDQNKNKKTGSQKHPEIQHLQSKPSEKDSRFWELQEEEEAGIGEANKIAIGLNILDASQDVKRRNFLKQVKSKKDVKKDYGKNSMKDDRALSYKNRQSSKKQRVFQNSDSIDMELIFDILEKKQTLNRPYEDLMQKKSRSKMSSSNHQPQSGTFKMQSNRKLDDSQRNTKNMLEIQRSFSPSQFLQRDSSTHIKHNEQSKF